MKIIVMVLIMARNSNVKELKQYVSKGLQHYGEYTTLEGHKAVKVKDVIIVKHAGGWKIVA